MNGSFLLLTDLKKRLDEAFQNFPFVVSDPYGRIDSEKDGKLRPPGVYIGQLPPRTGAKPVAHERRGRPAVREEMDDFDYVPFIVVKLLDYQADPESATVITANVGIVFTVFVPENDREAGMHDLLNMGDRIVSVLSTQTYWAENMWRRQMPISMVQGTGNAADIYESGLQDAGPYFGGAVKVSFSTARLEPLGPYGIIDSK